MKSIGSLITLFLILWSGYMEAQETNQFRLIHSDYTLNCFNVKSVEYYAPVYRETMMLEIKFLYKDSTSITFLITPRERRIMLNYDVYNLQGFAKRGGTNFYLSYRYIRNNGVFY